MSVGEPKRRSVWRANAFVLVWLGLPYIVPTYIAALAAPLWGGALGCVVSLAVLAVVSRWVLRSTSVRGATWRYRGVVFDYAAPASAVSGRPLDDTNYTVTVGADSRRVLGFAWYAAPGFPDGFGGEAAGFRDDAPGTELEEPRLSRRLRRPSAGEYVAMIPLAFLWALAFTAGT